jgi:hypothetical protein
MRFVAVALLLLFVALAAAATTTTTCLHGTIPLTLGVDAPSRAWCSRADCTLEWRLEFDAARVSTTRWPFEAWVNGTRLSSLFPTIVDAAVQCSSAGELIVTSASGPSGERVRLVWTYTGSTSFSCEYLLSTVDWRTDFRAFQALLSYSGHIATFDATASSQSVAQSLDQLRAPCQGTTTTTMAPPSSSSSSSATTDGHLPSDGETCVVGDCRRSVAGWLARPRDIAWRTIADVRFCSFSLEDIMVERRETLALPLHRRSVIRRLGAAYINAGMYGCALDEQFDELAEELANPTHCTLNTAYTTAERALDEYNNRDTDCSAVDEESTHSASVVHPSSVSTKKANAYLGWAIAMTALSGVLLLALGVTCIAAWPMIRQLIGQGMTMANRGGLQTFNDEVTAAPPPPSSSRPSFISSFFGASPYAEDGTREVMVPLVVSPPMPTTMPGASFGPAAAPPMPEEVRRFYSSELPPPPPPPQHLTPEMLSNVRIFGPRYD